MNRIDYSDCVIKVFMDAWFKGKRDILDEEQFEHIYIQYIDTSGLYITKEFEMVSYLHYLDNRIGSVALSIKLQREFIAEFGLPFIPELSFFKKFGYTLYYDPATSNIRDFLTKLSQIELKEKRFITTLQIKTDELIKFRKSKGTADYSIIQSRHAFLKMMQNLERIGYKIDRNVTTVEDLALMVKEAQEESQKQNQNEQKRR